MKKFKEEFVEDQYINEMGFDMLKKEIKLTELEKDLIFIAAIEGLKENKLILAVREVRKILGLQRCSLKYAKEYCQSLYNVKDITNHPIREIYPESLDKYENLKNTKSMYFV